MKVAIVGSSGYIASFIRKKFEEEFSIKNVLKIDQTDDADVYLNLLFPEQFNYSVLDEIDYIVFTAAISGPDKCANEFDFCWKINVIGTQHFIREAINRQCKVLFFSSDAVFGDIPGEIYNEESKTNAQTPYGRMKKAVEDTFKEYSLFKAIRLSYVASTRDRFISYCLNCIRNEEVADIFHPFYRNVITVSDVVDVVYFFALNWNEYEYTFLNVAGKELVSRVRIADEINRYLGDKLKYKISMPGEEFFSSRTRITQMASLYNPRFGIFSDNTISEKIAKELEGIEI